MYRDALAHLKKWKTSRGRKPLVIRGARQVGKSHLVRMFAESEFDGLAEVNFERTPEAATLFGRKDPARTVALLESSLSTRIVPGKTLLFLDEVQAAPEVFAALRYFHEQSPSLHVIAAGSLLEFVLADHSFSMPVGRIEYLHLGPMRFEEFLRATGQVGLCEFLADYTLDAEIPAALHAQLMRSLRQFLVVGGMPEVVRTFAEAGSYGECARVAQGILATYRDDFGKYAGRVDHRRIEKVFSGIPRQAGRKFMYSHVDREERARDLGHALQLLCGARVAFRVRHSDANGVPLGAEADDRTFKVVFMDVGLLLRSLGLSAADVEATGDVMLVNAGAACEQFVGQHLLYAGEPWEEPALHCWMRQKPGSSAEVDYLVQIGADIVPVEVKAGKSGTLKSMHMFLREKKRGFGLRLGSGPPSVLATETAGLRGGRHPFTLLSLPLYLVGQATRLCREARTR